MSDEHDRKGFRCGSESLERYLRETAKGHLAKVVSITRVMVERSTRRPKPILGYFTLTSTLVKAAMRPGAIKGLPAMPVPIVLLGRLTVAEDWQGHGIAAHIWLQHAKLQRLPCAERAVLVWLSILPAKNLSRFMKSMDFGGSRNNH